MPPAKLKNMKVLKRISKQAMEYLINTPFTIEEVKDGTVSLCRTKNGYETYFDIQEIPDTWKKKKLFQKCVTASDFIEEAVRQIDKGYELNIVKKALYSALEILKK